MRRPSDADGVRRVFKGCGYSVTSISVTPKGNQKRDTVCSFTLPDGRSNSFILEGGLLPEKQRRVKDLVVRVVDQATKPGQGPG